MPSARLIASIMIDLPAPVSPVTTVMPEFISRLSLSIMAKFFNLLATKEKMVSYGHDDVLKKIQRGAVEVLLLSEFLSDEEIDRFENEAANYSTKVEIISLETQEGAQLKEFGGIAAILRYEVHE